MGGGRASEGEGERDTKSTVHCGANVSPEPLANLADSLTLLVFAPLHPYI